MKNKDILLLLISIFIIIVAWIIFNIYHSAATSTISKTLNINILPISPNFDTKTIDKLKTRKAVSPIYSLSNKNFIQNSNASPSSNINIDQNLIEQATQGGSFNL